MLIGGTRWGRPCRTAPRADVRVKGSGPGGRSGEQGPGAPGATQSRPGAGCTEDSGAAPSPQGTAAQDAGVCEDLRAAGGATSPPRLGAGSAGSKNSPGRGLRAAARALPVPVCVSCVSSRPLPLALATPLRPGLADGGQWAPPSRPGTLLGPLGVGTGMRWPRPSRETVAWARP